MSRIRIDGHIDSGNPDWHTFSRTQLGHKNLKTIKCSSDFKKIFLRGRHPSFLYCPFPSSLLHTQALIISHLYFSNSLLTSLVFSFSSFNFIFYFAVSVIPNINMCISSFLQGPPMSQSPTRLRSIIWMWLARLSMFTLLPNSLGTLFPTILLSIRGTHLLIIVTGVCYFCSCYSFNLKFSPALSPTTLFTLVLCNESCTFPSKLSMTFWIGLAASLFAPIKHYYLLIRHYACEFHSCCNYLQFAHSHFCIYKNIPQLLNNSYRFWLMYMYAFLLEIHLGLELLGHRKK